jgi:tetratricopeptide (TPR) repeat protein
MTCIRGYRAFLFSTFCTTYIGLTGALNAPAWAQSEWADCSAAEPARIIRGCSTILSNTKVPAKQRAVAHVNRGIAYYDRGELEKALADYSSAIRVDPKNAEAHHNRADVRLRMGDLENAISDYGQAIALNPNFSSAHNGRGNALRESGQIDRAIADYDQAIKLDPRSPFPHNGRGNALRDKGDFAGAIQAYDRAIAIDPKYVTAIVGRANALSDQRDWPNALSGYDAAIAIDPKDPTPYNNRGTVHQNMGALDKAIQDYDTAVKLDPARSAFYFNRGLAYHLKGELDRAADDYAETIRRDANYAYAYHNRGLIFQDRNDPDRAIADYTKAIEINSDYAQSYLSRGTAFLKIGDARKAIDDLRRSQRLGETQPVINILLGEAYKHLRMYDAAKAEFDSALAKEPTSAQAYFQRGRLMQVQGRYEDASRDYAAALSLDSQLQLAQSALLETAEALKTAQAARLDKPAANWRHNRVALVIGNGAYQRVAGLPNPKRDAAAIARAFEKIGFRQVVTLEDLSRDDMLKGLRSFRELADTAEWAVIYYAGHGMETDGINYIIPVDAKLMVDRDIQDEAVPLTRFLDTIGHAKQLKLVILDACRDNPFASRMRLSNASRSIGRGLARVEPEGSTLVAYAAKHGQVAWDGKGEHSPFVAALLSRLNTPGLEIRKLFGMVRDDVLAATERQQEPFIYGTLGGDDYVINPK